MFTDPERHRRKDPGTPGDLQPLPVSSPGLAAEDQRAVEQQCRLAQIGCVDDKALLADQLIEFLTPIRERREELLRHRDTLMDIIFEGSRRASERAAETMEMVHRAISLDYRSC